jgi:hypothetical protein
MDNPIQTSPGDKRLASSTHANGTVPPAPPMAVGGGSVLRLGGELLP